jgi:hypothetical protein
MKESNYIRENCSLDLRPDKNIDAPVHKLAKRIKEILDKRINLKY